MAKDKESLIEQIVKLLAKANGTTNEHEADAFYKKAQSLMVQHAIDEEEVKRAGGKAKDEIVERTVYIRRNGTFRHPQADLLGSISYIFNCRTFFRDFGSKIPYIIVGFDTDAQFVEILFESIRTQSWRACLADTRDEGGPNKVPPSRNRSFLEGYYGRVVARLNERHRKVDESHGTGTSLALRDRGKQVGKYLKDKYSLVPSKGRRRQKEDWAAFNRGHEKGATADISGGRGHITTTKELN